MNDINRSRYIRKWGTERDMSILDWIMAIIVGVFVLILFLFLMGMALYSLFKIMGGIYEIFYDRQESGDI